MALDQKARYPYASYGEYTRSDLSGVFVQPNTRGVVECCVRYGSTFVNNKDWKVKVARDVDASAPFEKVEYTRYRQARMFFQGFGYLSTGGIGRYNSVANLCDYYDPSWHLLSMSQPYYQDDVALRDLALKRLKSKLQSRSNQYNVLVPAAELGELRGLLRNLTFSAVDLVRALIEIKRSRGRSALQYASHAWLSWSFAIAPTLADIKNACAAVESFMAHDDGKFTDYGASKKFWGSSDKSAGSAVFGLYSAELVAQYFHERSYRYVAGYRPKVRSANDYGVGKHFGLEFGAMVPTMWELTPFSWLFDYFTTMGDYLEDAFVSDAVNTIYVNCTHRFHTSALIDYKTISSPTLLGAQYSFKQGKFEFSYKKRSVLSSLPMRSLRFKSVDEVGKGGVNKLLNLASILVGSGKYFKPV